VLFRKVANDNKYNARHLDQVNIDAHSVLKQIVLQGLQKLLRALPVVERPIDEVHPQDTLFGIKAINASWSVKVKTHHLQFQKLKV
jgi:hypothetical protein